MNQRFPSKMEKNYIDNSTPQLSRGLSSATHVSNDFVIPQTFILTFDSNSISKIRSSSVDRNLKYSMFIRTDI